MRMVLRGVVALLILVAPLLELGARGASRVAFWPALKPAGGHGNASA